MSRKSKNLFFYIVMIVLFGSLMYVVIKEGQTHEVETMVQTTVERPSDLFEGFDMFLQLVLNHINSGVGLLLLQIITILLTCRLFGWLFMKIGQPTVIGEIVAGIVLGPSVLGHLFPGVEEFLFREESLANISTLSQFGLILFMFAIGMELDLEEVKKKLNATILISHTSTIVPFFLGMLTAYFIYDGYADKSTPFLSFSLFIGIALSITAFPVLARIIQEKGLTKTHLGTISLASAANGDITAWCTLAVVIAIAQAGTMLSAVYNIFFSIVYILFMFFAVRPFLRMVGHIYHNKEVVDKGLVAFIFLLLVFSSYLTEILGLHALFGAFIAGVVMPGNVKFRKIMTEKVEDVSLALFLPLFFVSTGLRTEIGLLNSPDLWGMCLLFIIVAIVGKFGGAMISARFVGESWKDSLYIGALMNTRGLMELVVLTIGYEMNILPPPVFVMLVLMTLVTTFMTTPLISFVRFCFNTHRKMLEKRVVMRLDNSYKVLLSFGRAGSGQVMLDVAHQMFGRSARKLDVTALHLTVGVDVNPLHTDNFEEVSFGPILYGAKKLGLPIDTRYEVATDAGHAICDIVNNEAYDFLLVGAGLSLSDVQTDKDVVDYHKTLQNRFFKRFKGSGSWFFPGDLVKDKTRTFIKESNCPVGVFVNRNFVKATNVLAIIDGADDLFLLSYIVPLLRSTSGNIAFVNMTDVELPEAEKVSFGLKDFHTAQGKEAVLYQGEITGELLSHYNFMLVSYPTWNKLTEQYKNALQKMPSTLIISKRCEVASTDQVNS